MLTSDRPPELRETGANQAINQTFLFGTHVRWFFDPGCPCSEFTTEALLSTIDHAVSKTLQPLPGPVHLNFPFREPFLENAEKQISSKVETITAEKVYIRNTTFSKVLPNSEIKELVLTDSIEASKEIKNIKNIRHISIAPLMGEAIKRINSDSSVSALFD